MAKFCGSCGAPLSEAAAFCQKCGTAQSPAQQPQSGSPGQVPSQTAGAEQAGFAPVNVPRQREGYASAGAQSSAQYTPVNPQDGPAMYTPAPAAKGSSTALKVVLGVVAVLFVGAVVVVGGLFYVGHKVVNKIKTTAAEKGPSMPGSSSEIATSETHGDLCSMLSKADVGAAIGVPIVATKGSEDGCQYLAEGTEADMTARHMSALMATEGADAETQNKVHQLAGGFFKQQQQEHHEQGTDENGMTPVVTFTIDTSGARVQMQLNQKLLGVLGPKGSTPLPGIGDEAFDSSGAMMFVRKGDKLARITYMTCPCNTEAIKPLARKLADAM